MIKKFLLVLIPCIAFAERVPIEQLQKFSQIYDAIQNFYVDEKEAKAVFENAISGMLSGLDPHSSYLPPKNTQQLRTNATGQFGGLGITITLEGGFVRVISPIDDTPAKRAGIEPSDLIIRINNERVQGMTLEQAVEKMRGKPGTVITITIVREGIPEPFDVTLKRDIIKLKSVSSKVLNEHFGYLRISQFNQQTAPELGKAIQSFYSKQMKGIVLDLRNNPGGLLNAAVDVSDVFLEEGVIVSIRGRGDEQVFQAKPGDLTKQLPIVVLINVGSASASEIVAGALQDNGRALIIGEKSFGKGSVQTVIPLEDGSSIKLYYSSLLHTFW